MTMVNGMDVAERKVVSGDLEEGTVLASDLIPGNILSSARGQELIVPFNYDLESNDGIHLVTIVPLGKGVVEKSYALVSHDPADTRKGFRIRGRYMKLGDPLVIDYRNQLRRAGMLA
ncbi:MAG: hypothetical protein WCP89_02415 [archaeon]